MKFPHNTDAWAYQLAALAKCADQIDYRAMLVRERRRVHFARSENSLALLYRFPIRVVEAELSMFQYGTSYREMCERGY